MTIVLDGKALAYKMLQTQKINSQRISFKLGRPIGFGVLLVGDDKASEVYVSKKIEACNGVGVICIDKRLPYSSTTDEIIEVVNMFNNDSNIDGILVQLPLPKHVLEHQVIETISPTKDVDGLTIHNAGALSQRKPCISPCTPLGVIRLLENYNIDVIGKDVVVVGDSNIVGRPLALMLLNKCATVTVCHKNTVDLKSKTKKADILMVAVGHHNLIGVDHIKKGAVVIDIGFNNINGKCTGDVDYSVVSKITHAITPVPGGVGPMTVSSLIDNLLVLAESHC